MTRSRLWLLAAVPIIAALIIATDHFVGAHPHHSIDLRSFDTCDDLHQHYLDVTELLQDAPPFESVSDEAVQAEEAEFAADEDFMLDDSAAVESAEAEEAIADEGEVSETGTNVQERGVDESDIIKTDGEYIYVLRPQSLLIAEIGEDGPLVEVGRLSFKQQGLRQELLIGDGKAIVIQTLESTSGAVKFDPFSDRVPLDPFEYTREQSVILEIDVSDPTAPTLARELHLDGGFLTARLVGDDLRVVFQHHSPAAVQSPWEYSLYHWSDGTISGSDEYHQAVRESLKLSNWFPLFGLQDHERGTFDDGYALECTQLYAPRADIPFRWGDQPSTSYLLSFDLSAGIDEWGSVGLLGTAIEPTVYASIDALYFAFAANVWWQNTEIHRFNIADTLNPSYFGGAVVEGQILSQWALSEHDGYLRVATTEHQRWPTVSSVTVLEPVEQDGSDANAPHGSLEEVGKVTGLGRTESIFAVRFAGDVGYVVTFRQVDPLYVLDLSDPSDPREVGELKIPGFSRYLHPLSGGLLFGVGRDADPQTGWERGLQATLFDVSDPTNPTQLSVLPLGDDAFSPVEFDHRAFRYQDGVAWIPVGPNDWHYRGGHDGAFLGVRVSTEGLDHESTLRVHGEARRAIPIEDQIHLLSDEEIRTYRLSDQEELGALSFASEWDNRWLPQMPESE